MIMQKITTWTLAIGAAIILAAGHLIDGPSEADLAQAQAADLADAQAQSAQLSRLVRKCHLQHGPSAELRQMGDEYICRAGEIQPVSADVMHRYALLGGGK